MMARTFIVLRREGEFFSTRGPVAQPLSLKDARDEIVRLKKTFPYQDFVIMGEVGEATISERVTVKIAAPDMSEPHDKPESPNVTPLRKGTHADG